MEDNKKASDKKVFIITPEELAKLGILESLTAEIKNTDKKIEKPTASSTSATKPKHFFKNHTEQLLVDLFKQKKVCNKPKDDKVVFKKPRKASNFKDIKDNATITKFPQTIEGEIKITDFSMASSSSSRGKCTSNILIKNVSNTIKSPIIPNKIKLESRKGTNKRENISIQGDPNRTTEVSYVSESKKNTNLISTSLKDKLKTNISSKSEVSTSEIKLNVDKSSKTNFRKTRKSVPNITKIVPVGNHRNTNNPSTAQDLTKSLNMSQNINNIDKNILKSYELKNKEETNTNISSVKDTTECAKEKKKNKIVILENIKILGVDSSGISELSNNNSLVSTPITDHNINLQNQTLTVNQNFLEHSIKTEFEGSQIMISKISLIQDDNNVNKTNVDMMGLPINNTIEEKLLLDSASVKLLDASNNLESNKYSSKITLKSNHLVPPFLNCNDLRSITEATVEKVSMDKLHESTKIVGLPQKEIHSKEIIRETDKLDIKMTSTTYDVDTEKPSDMYVQPSAFLLPKKRGRNRKSSVINNIIDTNVDSEEKYFDSNKSTTEFEMKDMKNVKTLKNTKLHKIESNLLINSLDETLSKPKSLLCHENLKTCSNLNPIILLPKKRVWKTKSSETVINDDSNKVCEKIAEIEIVDNQLEHKLNTSIGEPKYNPEKKTSLKILSETVVNNANDFEKTENLEIVDAIKDNVHHLEHKHNTLIDDEHAIEVDQKCSSKNLVDLEIRNHEEFGVIKQNVVKSGEDNVLKDTSYGAECSSLKKVPAVDKVSSEENTDFNLGENLSKKDDKANLNEISRVETIATPNKRGRPKKASIDAVELSNEIDNKLSNSISEASKHIKQLTNFDEKPNVDKDQTNFKPFHDDDCFKVITADQIQLKNTKEDNHKESTRSPRELDQEKIEVQPLLKHNARDSTSLSSNNKPLISDTIKLPNKIQYGVDGRKSVSDNSNNPEGIEIDKVIPYSKQGSRCRIPCRKNTQTNIIVEVNSTVQIPHLPSKSTDPPVKRKMGRPPKKINVENNVDIDNDFNIIENLDVTNQNMENHSGFHNAEVNSTFEEKCNISMNTSSANSEPDPKRKKSRKPKSEYVAPPKENIELSLEKSTRSRRHVKINYLELENMYVDDTDSIKHIKKSVKDDRQVETSFTSSDVTPKKKRGRPRKSEIRLLEELESVPSKLNDDSSADSKIEEKNDIAKTYDKDNAQADTSFCSLDVTPKKKRGRSRKSEITQPEEKMDVAELESVDSKLKDESSTASKIKERNDVATNKESEVNTNFDAEHSTDFDEKQKVIKEVSEIDSINSIGAIITPKDHTIYIPDDCLKVKDDKKRTYTKENPVRDLNELDSEKIEKQPILEHIAGERPFTCSNNKPSVCDTSNLPINDESKEGNTEKGTEIPCLKKSIRWRIPYRKNNDEGAIQRNKMLKQRLGRLHRKLELQHNVESNSTKPDSSIENPVNISPKLKHQREVHDGDYSTFEEKINISLNVFSDSSEPPPKKRKGRKPKSEYVAPPPPKENIESSMETSTRSRRHVIINYMELENMIDENNKDYTTKIKNPDKAITQADNDSDVTPKKKKGRPRKSESTLPEEKIETETESVLSKSQDGSNTALKVDEKNEVYMKKESENNLKSTDIECIEDSNIIKTIIDVHVKKKSLPPQGEITLSIDKPETSSTCTQSNPIKNSKKNENEVNIKTLEEVNAVPSTSFEKPASVVQKRGRSGRKLSKYELQKEEIKLTEIKSNRKCTNSVIDYTEMEDQLDEEIGLKKKRKRKLSSSDEELIKEPVERATYAPTGRYTKLINDIFSAAVLTSDGTETSSNASINQQLRHKGRPKKNVEPIFNIDENGKVTCVPCQIKISEEEWIEHNENKHGNLAWREGEPVVLFDQPAVLKDKLKPLLIKNKSLTCTKCNQKFITIKEFISHTEECMGIVVNGDVTCSICNKSMPKKSWSLHKFRHNNLTWRVGEHPLDLNNEAFVLQTLNALYKARKPLYCDKCGTMKKSVVGLLSHLGQCGNTDTAKIMCELCGRKMLPVSLPTHMKMSHETPKKVDKVEKTSDYFQVDLDVSQTKRKAAAKAMAKIDEFASDTKESSATHFIQNMKLEDNDALTAFINKELEEHKLIKCKISTCEFSCSEILDVLSHLKDCFSKLDQRFTCKTCFLTEPTEEGIIDHLRTAHNFRITKKDDDYVYDEKDNNEYDFFVDNENPLGRSHKRKRITSTQPYKDTSFYKQKPDFIRYVSKGRNANNNLFSHAFQYAFEFCEKNFHHKNLFQDLKCDESFWNLIDDDCLEEYMPPYELSCDVVVKNVKGMTNKNIFESVDKLKKYELFEVEQQDVNTTIFCGAPVRCLAWLPTPYKSSNEPQILAVATSKNFDEKYNYLEHYSETTVIQFWNFGLLSNCEQITEPKLEFCLGVNYGPVWCMEWCPSGCYDADESVEWSRRGLLAVAGHSMPVHIYSIPLLTDEQSGLFYKAKPVLKLQIVKDDNNLKRMFFPTKISWSKIAGHSHIAVGYSDGSVALYNLTISSKLLRFTDKLSVDVLMPYKIVKTHSHCISAIYLIPIDQGNRWLLTSSFDKVIHLWDLYTDDKFTVKKGKLAADVVWLTHWLSFITGGDESTAIGQAAAISNSHREYLYDMHTLSYSLSSITSISTSDWLNAFVHGNETGEIVVNFPHQMLYEMGRLRKSNDYRYLIGYSKLMDKTLSPEESAVVEEEKRKAIRSLPRRRKLQEARDDKIMYHWYEPFEYEEAAEKYGVAFCDTVDQYKSMSTYPDSEPIRSNLYPLMAVNQVSFNPNRQASLFFATGYQIGFVRVSYLKFLEKDQQIQRSKLR